MSPVTWLTGRKETSFLKFLGHFGYLWPRFIRHLTLGSTCIVRPFFLHMDLTDFRPLFMKNAAVFSRSFLHLLHLCVQFRCSICLLSTALFDTNVLHKPFLACTFGARHGRGLDYLLHLLDQSLPLHTPPSCLLPGRPWTLQLIRHYLARPCHLLPSQSMPRIALSVWGSDH